MLTLARTRNDGCTWALQVKHTLLPKPNRVQRDVGLATGSSASGSEWLAEVVALERPRAAEGNDMLGDGVNVIEQYLRQRAD